MVPPEDVGVPGREFDSEAVPEDRALPLSWTNSVTFGDCCDCGDAEVREATDAGETFRESFAPGEYEA